jgi:Lar family restriction alleviation protein
MSELKKCPFCGGEAEIIYDIGWYTGSCNACGAISQSDLGNSGAIEVWNTRPIEDALQARIDELAKDISDIRMLWNKAFKTQHDIMADGIDPMLECTDEIEKILRKVNHE